jgi:hypothetical protein
MAELTPGWGWPLNSRKAHYFLSGEAVSMCGKWLYSGEREDDNHGSQSNCAQCMRKRREAEERAQAERRA